MPVLRRFTVAQVTLDCPSGRRHLDFVGPNADAALKKALRRDHPGLPKYLRRCRMVGGIKLVQRGPGSRTRAYDELGGPRPRRRRRRR